MSRPKPKTLSWTRVKLDHFILWLETAGLTPTPDADPAVLSRRLHFDLVGLPPSPSAVRGFVERTARQGLDQTLAEEIDLLLASPRYGEHWGRHWLDVPGHSPNRAARRRTCRFRMPGAIAIT